MRQVRKIAQSIILLAMFAFYLSATEIRAASMEAEDFCPSNYCSNAYAYHLWDCTSGGGWECGWGCWNNYPDWCSYFFECCYPH